MADPQFLITDFGNLSGQGGKYMRVKTDEREVEFSENRDIEWHRCSVYKDSNQTVSGNGWVTITFNQELFDVGNMHDNITNNSRITVQESGLYRCLYQIKTESNDKVNYRVQLLKNNSNNIHGACMELVGSKDATYICLNNTCPLTSLVSGDYIEVQFQHDDVSTINVQSGNTFFEVLRIF